MSAKLPAFALLFCGCAHTALSPSTVNEIKRPIFLGRIEEHAGPRSTVFRDDSSYAPKLKKLDAKEGDRRLALKLTRGVVDDDDESKVLVPTISRFEVADTLRATTLALLPRQAPWKNSIDPVVVASTLQSFLVHEVPANAPDYELLKPLDADAVVEFVVEEYGMRSEQGRAGCYVVGYGRLFFLEGGGNVWYRSFRVDEVTSKQPHLDPFKVAKDPTLFREHMGALLRAVSEQFAQDLNPAGQTSPKEDAAPESRPQKSKKKKESGDELPAP